MSVDHQKLHKLLQSYEEIQAKRQRVKEFVEQSQLARSRARVKARRASSVSEDTPEGLDAERQISPSHECYNFSDDSGEDSVCPVPPPSIAESPSPIPVAPSEETLRQFATTVAYSSYSRLCGTSDDTLIRHLFGDELRKETAAILGPKKMVEIAQTDHNIAYLWTELAEGAASPFVASMTEARRQIDPKITTDDHVRRLGPAEILDDSLPIYWIVSFSQCPWGGLDWEGGCSLARAYHHVFEEFGAGDVHCLVFECEDYESEADLAAGYGKKVFVIE